MISDNEHDFPQKFAKIHKKKHLVLLTETHEVLLWLLKPQTFMYSSGGTHLKPFPPDHIVDLEEAAMGWVLRLQTYILVVAVSKNTSFKFHRLDITTYNEL